MRHLKLLCGFGVLASIFGARPGALNPARCPASAADSVLRRVQDSPAFERALRGIAVALSDPRQRPSAAAVDSVVATNRAQFCAALEHDSLPGTPDLTLVSAFAFGDLEETRAWFGITPNEVVLLNEESAGALASTLSLPAWNAFVAWAQLNTGDWTDARWRAYACAVRGLVSNQGATRCVDLGAPVQLDRRRERATLTITYGRRRDTITFDRGGRVVGLTF